MSIIYRGCTAKIYKDGVPIGSARNVKLKIKRNLESYYGVDTYQVAKFIPGKQEASGTLGKAWIDKTFLDLLITRNADGSLPAGTEFELKITAKEEVGAPVITLKKCRFTKGKIDIPQDGWLEEDYDFISYGDILLTVVT